MPNPHAAFRHAALMSARGSGALLPFRHVRASCASGRANSRVRGCRALYLRLLCFCGHRYSAPREIGIRSKHRLWRNPFTTVGASDYVLPPIEPARKERYLQAAFCVAQCRNVPPARRLEYFETLFFSTHRRQVSQAGVSPVRPFASPAQAETSLIVKKYPQQSRTKRKVVR
eukprot:520684-Prorocentrum_minimum.AAC.2